MFKMIGGDGQVYGPVTAEELRLWIAEGRANAQTLVQAEGSADWRPLGSLPELAAFLGRALAPLVDPGEAPGPDEPGAAAFGPAPAAPPALDALLEREYEIDLGACFRRAWELLQAHFALLVGSTLIVLLAQVGALAVTLSLDLGLGQRPGLLLQTVTGLLAGLVQNVFQGGLLGLVVKLVRGEPAEIGDLFERIASHFGQLALTALAVSVPGLLLTLLMIASGINGPAAEVSTPMLVAVLLVGLPIAIYFSVSWFFAPVLVVDRGLTVGVALEVSRRVVWKRFWWALLLVLVTGLVAVAGVLACCVGVVLSLAFSFAAVACAYEQIFGTFRPRAG